MDIADLITPRSVVAQLRAANKRHALQELARRAAAMSGSNERTIYDVLIERERLGSTGIGMGVGIPHGKLPALTTLYGIFARRDRPIPFAAIDEHRLDIGEILHPEECEFPRRHLPDAFEFLHFINPFSRARTDRRALGRGGAHFYLDIAHPALGFGTDQIDVQQSIVKQCAADL